MPRGISRENARVTSHSQTTNNNNNKHQKKKKKMATCAELGIDPSDLKASLKAAKRFLDEQKPDDCITVLREAIGFFPGDYQILILTGYQ